MTTSIPTFLSEPSIPTDVPRPVDVAVIPAARPVDFAGLLAGAAPQVVATPCLGISPPEPLGAAPRFSATAAVAGTTLGGDVDATPGQPAPPPGQMPARFSGMIRPLAREAAVSEATGEPARQTAEAPSTPAAEPTRAEQEEAMAMLTALFPLLPVAAQSAIPSATPPTEAPVGPVIGYRAPSLPSQRAPATVVGFPIPAPVAATESIHLPESPGGARMVYAARHPEAGGTPSTPAQSERAVDEVHARMAAEAPTDSNPTAVLVAIQGRAGSVIDFPTTPAPETAQELGDRAMPPVASPPEANATPVPVAGKQTPGFRMLGAVVTRADGVRLAERALPESTGAEGGALGGEISAGREPATGFRPAPENRASGKKVLTAFEQRLAEDAPERGTTAANALANMNPRSFPSLVPAHGPVADPKSADLSAATAPAESPAVVAPRVLAAVLEVAAAQESARLRPAPAVHLRLQVAGETVGLKVELRDEAVQTRFTAVSPELRAALTREWQASRSEAPEGAPRLLDPVFPSPADRGGTSPAGQESASHQQPQARSWSFPWESQNVPAGRRTREAAAPEPAAVALPAVDERLLSALA